jgi:circadian clock protein KaiC
MKKDGKVKTVRSKTGVPGLDDILNGGLIPNRLYLVDGDPGSEKTTLSLQFLLEGLKDGEKCLYITLSETKEELTAGAESHGWSLDRIEIVELIPDAKELNGETQVTMYHPSEVELSETTKRVLEAVERVNPSRIVFDSLSEIRLLAQNPLRYRRQVLALKQFFIGRHPPFSSLTTARPMGRTFNFIASPTASSLLNNLPPGTVPHVAGSAS